MTITTTFENNSAESSVSVDHQPFGSWTLNQPDVTGRNFRQAAKITGDSPQYPLVRIVESRDSVVYHPDHQDEKVAGRRLQITLHTTQVVEDSVSGLIQHVPVNVQIAVSYGGAVIENSDDLMQFLLSAVAEYYGTVTTGVPATTILDKLSLGSWIDA